MKQFGFSLFGPAIKAAAIGAALMLSASAGYAQSGPFSGFNGAWSGNGDVGSGELVIQYEFFEGEVVGVNVAAGIDGDLGAADHLAIALHSFSGSDVPESEFVAGGDGVASLHGKAVHAEVGTGGKGHAGDGDVVGGVEVDGGVFSRREFGDFEEHVYLSRRSSGASSPMWTWSRLPAGWAIRHRRDQNHVAPVMASAEKWVDGQPFSCPS